MNNKLKTVDAETLLSTPMSKTMFIVDGLISQGVNVISGASKIGKSWLMLWLRLKKLSQEGLLDDQTIYAVLAEEKPNQQEQIKLRREDLKKYFPIGYTDEQMRWDILKGLELLKRQRERNRDAR